MPVANLETAVTRSGPKTAQRGSLLAAGDAVPPISSPALLSKVLALPIHVASSAKRFPNLLTRPS
jgi:hypothetical protein